MSEPSEHKAGWTKDILREVEKERARQDEKWGEQHHLDDAGPKSRELFTVLANNWKKENAQRVQSDRLSWDGILAEEVYEALSEEDPDKKIEELVQVAAVAVVWIEDLISRKATSDGHRAP